MNKRKVKELAKRNISYITSTVEPKRRSLSFPDLEFERFYKVFQANNGQVYSTDSEEMVAHLFSDGVKVGINLKKIWGVKANFDVLALSLFALDITRRIEEEVQGER